MVIISDVDFDTALTNLLNRHGTAKHFTHTAVTEKHGKYMKFKFNDVEDLQQLYSILSVTSERNITSFIETLNPRFCYHLTEKPLAKHRPLTLDFDIKVICDDDTQAKLAIQTFYKFIDDCERFKDLNEYDKSARKCMFYYKYSDVMTVIKITYKLAQSFFSSLEPFEKVLKCAFQIKPPRYKHTAGNGEKHEIINGFHLHFPYIFASFEDLKSFCQELEKEFKKHFADGKIFKTLENDAESPVKTFNIFDKAVLKSNWLLYGASKNEDSLTYLAYEYFDHECNVIDFANFTQDAGISKMQAFSITVERPILNRKTVADVQQSNSYDERSTPSLSDDGVRFILDNLPVEAANERELWIRVAFALINLYEKDVESAFKMFNEFSKKCPEKYNPDTIRKDFDGFVESNRNRIGDKCTIYSLKSWLSNEKKHEFNKCFRPFSISETDNIFNVKYIQTRYNEKYIQKFIFDDVSATLIALDKQYYKYDGVVYRYMNTSLVKHYLVKEYLEPIYNHIREVQHIVNTRRDIPLIGNIENELEAIKKTLISALKVVNYASLKPIGEIEGLLNIDVVKSGVKFDKNPYLFAFKNCVFEYDENDHTVAIRPGYLTDYITMQANVDYDPDITDDHEDMILFNEFINNIFPDKDVKEYVIRSLAACLVGKNYDRTINFWVGNGRNGKSMLKNVCAKLFGNEYMSQPGIEEFYVSKSDNSNKAKPQTYKIMQSRISIVPEVEDAQGGKKLDVGLLKSLTGNDDKEVRRLYENSTTIANMTHIFMCCNNMPNIHFDQAMSDRTRVVPFKTRFITQAEFDTGKYTLGNYKLADDTFVGDAVQLRLAKALAKILVDKQIQIAHERRNKINPPPLPPDVEDATASHILECRALYNFISYMFEINSDNKKLVKWEDIYAKYNQVPLQAEQYKQLSEFKEQFKIELKCLTQFSNVKMTPRGIYGVTLKDGEQDDIR